MLADTRKTAPDRHLRRRQHCRRCASSGLSQGRPSRRRHLRSRCREGGVACCRMGHPSVCDRDRGRWQSPDAIFDLATPPAAHAAILSKLPVGSRRPDPEADGRRSGSGDRRSSNICRDAATAGGGQFPASLCADDAGAASDAIAKGYLGEIVDFDALACTCHALGSLAVPEGAAADRDRHALDPLSRPRSADCSAIPTVCTPRRSAIRTMRWRRPARPPFSTTATSVRCVLSVNHDHDFGRKFQACEFRISGTEGCGIRQTGRQSRLSARRARRAVDPASRGARNGWRCRLTAPGSPTPSPTAWPICNASPAARTRS